MNIVMTGGGTGGHIYPALAIADEFRRRDPDARILYIGDKNCMESQIVPAAGYEFKDVPAEEVNRKNVFKLVKTAYKNILGINAAKKIMKEFRPDAVIGTGGFVSFPVIYAGHKLGAKCYFHEQNAFPGLANRTLEKYVERVFLGFEAAGERFRQPEKHMVTGNPVRHEFYEVDRAKAREKLGIPEDSFVILSFGGSLGAKKINDVMYRVMKELIGEKITLLFGTGKAYYDDIMKKVEEDGLELTDNIRIQPYIDDMVSFLGASDLVVSRSGALTLAETGVCGRASILIPSPNVTGNHQYHNAKVIADRGGAVLINEEDFDPDRMMRELSRMISDRSITEEMGEKARDMNKIDTTKVIYDAVTEDLGR